MTLYEKIASAAKNAGMSVSALEQAAGLSKGAISKWRFVEPRIGNLVRVALVLNVDINDLIGGDPGGEVIEPGKKG